MKQEFLDRTHGALDQPAEYFVLTQSCMAQGQAPISS